jgi:type IV secretory pathway VirB2 component (pilin)
MNSKKLFSVIVLLSLLLITFIPFLAKADGLVPCSGLDCTISSFFQLLLNIYNFIVWDIATPLAVIALTIGGIFMMISAGNPELMGKGKKTLYAAIIGLVLVFGSWLIINTILNILGYQGAWSTL